MHRHGYKGRKFGRERDQRRALIKSLAEALIINEKIETTLPKAKELVPYTENLITKSKKGGLHNRRQVIAKLQTLETAHKLFDEITPKLGARNGGHFRIVKTSLRRGDNAQMAEVSFVDDLSKPAQAQSKAETKPKAQASKAATSKAKEAK